MSYVELGLSGISKWRADENLPSNSPKNGGETGIFAEGDVGIKDTGKRYSRTDGKVIVLVKCRHISSLSA